MSEYILRMSGITKTFPGVRALSNVNIDVKEGTIHGIVGENGAGKSTLMKILSGVYPHGKFDGSIELDGHPVRFRGIKQSESAGIVIIHQELALIPQLSVAENIFLGNERSSGGVISWGDTNTKAVQLLQRVGLNLDPSTLIENLGVGQQQLVEIAKALSKRVKILILDEPTAALSDTESDKLLSLLEGLREHGVTSILITHKLDEIRTVADSITVIRDGEDIETMHAGTEKITNNRIIASMVGRELTNLYPPRHAEIGETIFEIEDWNILDPHIAGRHIIRNGALNVRAGEVVGLAGLMGAGRTELARSIFGRNYGIYQSGTLQIKGKTVRVRSPKQAIDAGIAYVTEDRKELGLHLDYSIKQNFTMANLARISHGSIIDNFKENRVAQELKEQMLVKSNGIEQNLSTLSGGNQQKVVLGKWLFTNPDLLILDEPTRGVDVGAKYEIYEQIFKLAAEGMGILVISSELPELLGISDRIYAMGAGRITGELPANEATQESLMSLMTMNNTPEEVYA